MTDLKKLESLTELTVTFKEAAEAHVAETAGLQEKILEALEPGEMEKAQKLATDLAAGGLSAMFGGVSEEFMNLNIEASDFTAKILARAVGQDTLESLMPEELKTAEYVEQLENAGAANLAKICKNAL